MYGYGERDVALVATGWFPQNPPEYYQIRIDRLLLATKSRNLTPSEYDDLAVAYDHLGKDDDALKWIQEKVRLMKAGAFARYDVLPSFAASEDPWQAERPSLHGELPAKDYHAYSAQANWGTFLIHRWIRAGMPPDRIQEAEEARQHIDAAIDIDPNAHAGREVVQSAIIQWLVDQRRGATTLPQISRVELAGLRGLVELGAAWNSYDVFALLSSLEATGRGKAFCYLRCQELLAEGKTPLTSFRAVSPDPDDVNHYSAYYRELRESSKQALKERFAFMRKRFAEGMHPDTSPDFWKGYTGPELPVMYLPLGPRALAYYIEYIPFSCCLFPFAPLVAFFVVMRRRRRAKAAEEQACAEA